MLKRANCGSGRTHSIASSARTGSEGGMVSSISRTCASFSSMQPSITGPCKNYKIMSTPEIVINGELVYTGRVSETVQPDWI